MKDKTRFLFVAPVCALFGCTSPSVPSTREAAPIDRQLPAPSSQISEKVRTTLKSRSEDKRTSYEESCRILQREGHIEAGAIPLIPKRRPRYDDDEPLGVSFFRTYVDEAKFENMTLRRTFFGRSEISKTSLRHTDLSESSFNWNDFIDVDFSFADLTNSDFRSSILQRVRFTDACLTGVDFRHTTFDNCDFTRTNMSRVRLSRRVGKAIRLSPEQIKSIDWCDEEGDVPGGG